jgi:Zn-dependent protease with chaperone function
MLLIGPLWIAPLFNHFGPMKDKALETRILALAARSGIEGGRVYEVDKSVDTKAVNAYVTGLFGSKRIVLWDTLLGRLDDRHVLAVMGHEMGHYVLGHVRTMIALNALVVLVTLYLAHRTAGGLIRRYAGRFGFDQLHDVASLPLLILLANVFSLVVSPVVLGYSRHIEHEADRFALELTHDNRAVAGAFVKLQEENLAVPRPHPLLVLFRSSHPPLGQRIDFANDYRPWESGARPRYGSYIRDVP